MKLMTKAIAEKLPRLYSCENQEDPIAIVKFFTPDSSWSWFVCEAEEQENGDYLFFGKVIGLETELGYFRLSELNEARGPLGLPVERDIYFSPRKLSECK